MDVVGVSECESREVFGSVAMARREGAFFLNDV